MKQGLICSRCNKILFTTAQCQIYGCEHPEYHKAMSERFKWGLPAKYYCSLMGVRDTGKTQYLLSLVNILLNQDKATSFLLTKLGIDNIEMIDPISVQLFSELKFLSTQGRITSTDPSSPLGYFNIILTMNSGRSYEIVLFNTPGEKIEDKLILNKIFTDFHEMQGAATLYFVDPLQDSKLTQKLNFPLAVHREDVELSTHIYKVLQKANKGIKIVYNPLAICISKFDLLLHRIPFEIQEHPFVEVNSKNYFKDIKKASQNLESFLSDNSQNVNPDSIRESFNRVSYFAIAPVGNNEPKPRWSDKTPKGILAPFLWVLKELHIINTENGN